MKMRKSLSAIVLLILGVINAPAAEAGTLLQLCQIQRNTCLLTCEEGIPWGAYAADLQFINENCGWSTYKVPICAYDYYAQNFGCTFTLSTLGFAPGQPNYSRLLAYHQCRNYCPRCNSAPTTPDCQ